MFAAPNLRAQRKPDFSGVWEVDVARSDDAPIYGHMRIIKQTDTEVDMTAVSYDGKLFNIVPWQFRFNRWGPRRGGERSREPLVQARWDGEKVIAVKAPGESYSVMWIWSLSRDGKEMTVESLNWTSIPTDFDFKESSIPAVYARSNSVYTRSTDGSGPFIVDGRGVTWGEDDRAKLSFRLQSDATALSIQCHAKECKFSNIVAGRRQDPRTRLSGGVVAVEVASQTVIETGP
jgi:hypothetical protein